DPSQDPLRRRPQRRQQPPQQPRDAQQYQQPQQQYQQRPQRQQQYQPQRQQYQPQPQQQAYAPPQQPQQPAQRAPREPRRSANPMKIPGLGCLKGCLFTLVLLFVASWLIWELTPLKDWIGTGQSYWHAITDAFSTVKDWMSKLGSGN
ncbi:serine/threonine protein kinase, partial [Streptomyces sp. SID9124]|nr:serine/threonine protein kinase [Streptomyces sp. SID9124]